MSVSKAKITTIVGSSEKLGAGKKKKQNFFNIMQCHIEKKKKDQKATGLEMDDPLVWMTRKRRKTKGKIKISIFLRHLKAPKPHPTLELTKFSYPKPKTVKPQLITTITVWFPRKSENQKIEKIS